MIHFMSAISRAEKWISMVAEQLEKRILEEGYDKASSNLAEFVFYFKTENHGINVLCRIDFSAGLYLTQEQYAHVKETIRSFFAQRGEQNVHILTLILCTETDKARLLCQQDRFCWLLDVRDNRLLVYEEQVSDFYGWRELLEQMLSERSSGAPEETYQEQRSSGGRRIKEKRSLPWVNLCLVAVNVIVFLICTFTDDLLYNIGALSIQNLIADGSFYRMVTCMFLHADPEHLISNMVVLYYVGEIVEQKTGHLPYILLYFLSGLGADVMSMAYELWTGRYISSVGASGAVFGIEGALLLLAVLHRGRLESMTAGRVAFAIAFSLYCGFTSSYINNAAHVGGVMTGMVVMGLLWMVSPQIRKRG